MSISVVDGYTVGLSHYHDFTGPPSCDHTQTNNIIHIAVDIVLLHFSRPIGLVSGQHVRNNELNA